MVNPTETAAHRERDIDAALETARACRLEASLVAQMKMFPGYTAWLVANARAAEKWAVSR